MRLGSAASPYSRRAGWLRYPLPSCLRRPRSAAFTSIFLPNRWCAQMRRTERRGYRTAKVVELLVEVRRRTEYLVPAVSAKRSLPNGKQMRRSWLQLGQGSRKPGQDGGWQKHLVGMPGRRFLLRISHGRAIAAWRGLCVVFAFAIHISRVRCFFCPATPR